MEGVRCSRDAREEYCPLRRHWRSRRPRSKPTARSASTRRFSKPATSFGSNSVARPGRSSAKAGSRSAAEVERAVPPALQGDFLANAFRATDFGWYPFCFSWEYRSGRCEVRIVALRPETATLWLDEAGQTCIGLPEGVAAGRVLGQGAMARPFLASRRFSPCPVYTTGTRASPTASQGSKAVVNSGRFGGPAPLRPDVNELMFNAYLGIGVQPASIPRRPPGSPPALPWMLPSSRSGIWSIGC